MTEDDCVTRWIDRVVGRMVRCSGEIRQTLNNPQSDDAAYCRSFRFSVESAEELIRKIYRDIVAHQEPQPEKPVVKVDPGTAAKLQTKPQATPAPANGVPRKP